LCPITTEEPARFLSFFEPQRSSNSQSANKYTNADVNKPVEDCIDRLGRVQVRGYVSDWHHNLGVEGKLDCSYGEATPVKAEYEVTTMHTKKVSETKTAEMNAIGENQT
jgi:hypothetical protein